MEIFDYPDTIGRLYERAALFDSPIHLSDDGHLRWAAAEWQVELYPLDYFSEAQNFGLMRKTYDDRELVMSRTFIFSARALQRCIHLVRPSNEVWNTDKDILMGCLPIVRQFSTYTMPNEEDKADFVQTLEW